MGLQGTCLGEEGHEGLNFAFFELVELTPGARKYEGKSFFKQTNFVGKKEVFGKSNQTRVEALLKARYFQNGWPSCFELSLHFNFSVHLVMHVFVAVSLFQIHLLDDVYQLCLLSTIE